MLITNMPVTRNVILTSDMCSSQRLYSSNKRICDSDVLLDGTHIGCLESSCL